jgi:cytochrome P450
MLLSVCWNLIYIGTSPEWRKKIAAEIDTLVARHTDSSSGEPLHKQLSKIPLEAWEDELPLLDFAMRETLRLVANGAALRRNLHKDLEIEGITIKKGEFLTYSMADIHMNPEIYPDPTRFDPGRYEKGREEDRKAYYAFGAWGLGQFSP